MQERIFILKKGVEVPAQFDGVTIPFQVPANNADMLAVAGENAYLVFNEAYALRVQKDVKDEANEEGATIETLRQCAVDYKIGAVRTRKAGSGDGKPRVTGNQVDRALGEDFLAMLTPEQRVLYEAKKAALKAKPAATQDAVAANTAAPTAPSPTQAEAPKAATPAAGKSRKQAK
jgi:hypothetical protein